jgi:hypothetical protein
LVSPLRARVFQRRLPRPPFRQRNPRQRLLQKHRQASRKARRRNKNRRGRLRRLRPLNRVRLKRQRHAPQTRKIRRVRSSQAFRCAPFDCPGGRLDRGTARRTQMSASYKYDVAFSFLQGPGAPPRGVPGLRPPGHRLPARPWSGRALRQRLSRDPAPTRPGQAHRRWSKRTLYTENIRTPSFASLKTVCVSCGVHARLSRKSLVFRATIVYRQIWVKLFTGENRWRARALSRAPPVRMRTA